MSARYERSTAHLIPPESYETGQPIPEIVRPLLEARTEDDLRVITAKSVRALGFDTITYGAAIRLRETWEPWFTVWTTMPAEWVLTYTRTNLIEIDPRILAGFGKPTPLFWDRYVLSTTPGCNQFFDRAEKAGLCSGIGFYMPGIEFEHYMVSFNSSRSRCTWIDESTAGRAYIFASYFHEFYRSALIADRLRTPLAGHPLTTRELECLNLVARGMTNPQIGRVMLITDRGVAFHISSILAKLRAENRTEAVALAMRTGILERRKV